MEQVNLQETPKQPDLAHYGYDQPASQPTQLPNDQPPPYSQPQTKVLPQPYVQQGYPPQQQMQQGYPQLQPCGQQPYTQPQSYMAPTTQTNTNVILNQQAPTTIIARPLIRPNSYIGFSIFILLCVNPLFGIIALVFSIMSASDADDGNYEGARQKGRVAMWVNVSGILSGVVGLIIFFIMIRAY